MAPSDEGAVMAQKGAMTGGENEKMIFFSPSVAFGASSLIRGSLGCAAFQTTIYPSDMEPHMTVQNSVDLDNQKLELCNKEMLHTKHDCSTLIIENI